MTIMPSKHNTLPINMFTVNFSFKINTDKIRIVKNDKVTATG